MSQQNPAPGSEIILCQTEDGRTRLEVKLENETVWLSLNQMAELFQRDKSVISKHLKNVFGEGELVQNSVVANFATTAADGKTYQVDYYNLDAIISVGYRVKSAVATRFRIWATQKLREFIVNTGDTANRSKWPTRRAGILTRSSDNCQRRPSRRRTGRSEFFSFQTALTEAA